jgi:hypothetical protein
MTDFIDDIEEVETGFLDSEIADAIPEALPQRNKPYYANPLFQNVLAPVQNFQQAIASDVSDKELEQMAELEADFLLTILKTTLAVIKGGIGGYVFNDSDKNRLQELQNLGEVNSKEAIEIMERYKLSQNVGKTQEIDEKQQRDFLVKVVKIDFYRKKREGRLKFDNSYTYLGRMFLSGLMSITGQNYDVISLVGRRMLNRQ